MKFKNNLLFIIAFLIFASCSPYKKYEGIYQMTDYSGIKDVYKIEISNDSISMGEIHYYHKNTGRTSRALGKSVYTSKYAFQKKQDSLVINAGDTLLFVMKGDGYLEVKKMYYNKSIGTSQTFFKKKPNFRIRLGNGIIRF